MYGDIYSYGVIFSEMFTGKRPTNDIFKNGVSLRRFVDAEATSEDIMEIIDQAMLSPTEADDVTSNEKRQISENLILILKVGLACSDRTPREPMCMTNIAAKMRKIRSIYQQRCMTRLSESG